MREESKTKSTCSTECEYLFYECEPEGISYTKCQTKYNKCVRKCLLPQLTPTIGVGKEFAMKKMPSRDTVGKCKGECRNRVREGAAKRQKIISSEPYSTPAPNSPPWAKGGNDTPGAWDGHGL